MYQKLVKPLLFMIEPETAHNFVLYLGRFASWTKLSRIFRPLFVFHDESLESDVLGVHFENPVGLAGGFDKNAELTGFFPDIGFGFMEVGSITAKPCAGNPKPRLHRIIKNKGIVVNYGLMNQGAERIYKRLKNKSFRIPVFINIAKTNDSKIKGNASVTDYIKSFKILYNAGDFFVVNISCPNAGDGLSFEDPVLLEKLLTELQRVKKNKKIFLKISPDVSKTNLNKIINLAEKYLVDGFVISNLTKDRSSLIKENGLNFAGGISGQAVNKKSNNLISYVYSKTKGKFVIIGCGGIFNGKDAYEKIKCGATLVELITGMVYEGPSVIKRINDELSALLAKDRYGHIREAVGTSALKS